MARFNREYSRTAIPQLEKMIDQANAKIDELKNVLGELETIRTELDGKQDILESGKNIKTINHNSLLGEGNIDVQGGGGGGTSDHSQLSNRDLPGQHPISAITNLQTSLNNKSNAGHTHEQYITEEEDPTVPDWAKEPTKPTYTAEEVGALPDDTVIPTKTSELINDSGFVTEGNTKVIYDVTGITYDDISDYLYVYDDIVVEFHGVRYRFYHKDTDMHYFTSATDIGVAYVTLDITNRWRVTSVITPTKTSDVTNDSGFVTEIDLSDVAFSGDYNDLVNQPTIPSPTTVEQVLTSGTEIAKVNNVSLFAPQGGGGQELVENSATVLIKGNGGSITLSNSTAGTNPLSGGRGVIDTDVSSDDYETYFEVSSTNDSITVKKSGIYIVNAGYYFSNNFTASDILHGKISVNGASGGFLETIYRTPIAAPYHQTSKSVVVKLNANDSLQIRMYNQTASRGTCTVNGADYIQITSLDWTISGYDFPVEQGITNEWQWVKWNSGRYEAERCWNIGQATIGNTLTSYAKASNVVEIAQPPHTLISGYIETNLIGNTSNSGVSLERVGYNQFRLRKDGASAVVVQGVMIGLRVVAGRWK